MRNLIDPNFAFYSDTPTGKDPDSYSPTLRRYHKILWGKPLPNGLRFDLTDTTPKVYLHHQSELGEFFLSSDSIAHSYSRLKGMLHIIDQVPSNEVDSFSNIIALVIYLAGELPPLFAVSAINPVVVPSTGLNK